MFIHRIFIRMRQNGSARGIKKQPKRTIGRLEPKSSKILLWKNCLGAAFDRVWKSFFFAFRRRDASSGALWRSHFSNTNVCHRTRIEVELSNLSSTLSVFWILTSSGALWRNRCSNKELHHGIRIKIHGSSLSQKYQFGGSSRVGCGNQIFVVAAPKCAGIRFSIGSLTLGSALRDQVFY